MKRVLIIGINSFLSKNIALLLKGAYEITGVYHTRHDNLLEFVYNLPIKDIDQLKNNFDYVLYISAFIPHNKNEQGYSEDLYKVNVSILEDALNKFSNAKFIYASSVSIYGINDQVKNELSCSWSVSEYGLSKLWGEALVSKNANNVIIRISSMYGIGMNQSTFIPRIIQQVVDCNVITLYGTGLRYQNYISVNDVAKMFTLSLNDRVKGTLLAADINSYSNLDIANIVINNFPQSRIELVGTDNSMSFYYDPSQSYTKLNFCPQIGIIQGVMEMIECYTKPF